MIRSQGLKVVALVGVLLLSPMARSAPLPVGKTALQEVPASTPLVIHIRGIEGTIERALTLFAQVDAEQAKMARAQASAFLENGRNGRKSRGLAKDGPVFVMFPELPRIGQRLQVAVLVAVTNYKEFRDNLLTEKERKALQTEEGVESTDVEGRTLYFVDRKGYAVIASSKELAGQLARKGAGLDTRISKDLGDKLLAADLGVYLNMDVFNKDYAEQIKGARQTLDALMQFALAQFGKDQNPGLEIVEKMIGPLFQGVEDSQGLVLGVALRPAGLSLYLQTELKTGSVSNKALADARVSAFQELGQLPAGQTFYTGLAPSPVFFQTLANAVFGVLLPPDSDANKKVQAAITNLVNAGPGTRVDCASLPTEGLQVWHFNNPEAAVAAQLKLMEGLASGAVLGGNQLKEKPVITKNAEKHSGFEFHSIKLVWDLEKMLAPQTANLPEEARQKMVESMKKLLGEGTTVYVGTNGKQYIQLAAKDWAAARKLLDRYLERKTPIDGEASFKGVRKELPAETTFLMVMDAVRYAATVVEATKPVLGKQFDLPKNFPAPRPDTGPSFVGLALTVRPERAGVDFHISAAAMKDGYTVFGKPLRAAAEKKEDRNR